MRFFAWSLSKSQVQYFQITILVMREDFLHYVWRFSYFDTQDLRDVRGRRIKVYNLGILNKDAGPDFHDAQVEVDGVLWSGSVEIHLKSSDWLRHGHQNDPAYDNVILHVVWENDVPIAHREGVEIPALELHDRINRDVLERHDRLLGREDNLPCGALIQTVSDVKMRAWLDRSLATRLDRKGEEVLKLYDELGNWEDVARVWLFRAMGHKVNAEPFECLARNIPGKAIAKQSDSWETLEALLFGVAGFLQEEPVDAYQRRLSGQYQLLERKYELASRRLDRFVWKFSRMRPSNYPTIRISHLASFLYRHSSIFNLLAGSDNLASLQDQFSIKASDYWRRHHDFGKTSARPYAKVGLSTIQYLVANVAVPFLYAYGKCTGKQTLCDRATSFLEALPPEKNTVLEQWEKVGVCAGNAFDSQALLERYNESCVFKKCPDCLIGHEILRS